MLRTRLGRLAVLGGGEVHVLEPRLGDGEVSGRDVAQSFVELTVTRPASANTTSMSCSTSNVVSGYLRQDLLRFLGPWKISAQLQGPLQSTFGKIGVPYFVVGHPQMVMDHRIIG